ncbi:MAG: hypothetical protein MK105_05660 [Crocinitomicaceae bacterium]|nr:hypothetical protein [Crocinitomicaceae bacterium]
MDTFTDTYNKLLPKGVNFVRKLYVGAYNIYGFYWLYKIIFVLDQNWENYVVWFFAMAGQLFFTLDNKEKLGIKDYMKNVD